MDEHERKARDLWLDYAGPDPRGFREKVEKALRETAEMAVKADRERCAEIVREDCHECGVCGDEDCECAMNDPKESIYTSPCCGRCGPAVWDILQGRGKGGGR